MELFYNARGKKRLWSDTRDIKCNYVENWFGGHYSRTFDHKS